jgi:hypothetical protein
VNCRTWLTACLFAVTLGVAGGAVHASVSAQRGMSVPPASTAALPAPPQQAGTATAGRPGEGTSAGAPEGSSPVAGRAVGTGRSGSGLVRVLVPREAKSKPAKPPKPIRAHGGHGAKKAHGG